MQVPEEAARTALGMARAMTRNDDEGAQHLWVTTENQDQVAQAFAVLLANIIGRLSTKTGKAPEDFYADLQRGIDESNR